MPTFKPLANFSEYGGLSDEFQKIWSAQPPPLQKDLVDLKEATNAGREQASKEAFRNFASTITTTNYNIPTRDYASLQARTYVSSSNANFATPLPLYIHLHGGGYLFGTLDSEDAACARIAAALPVVVLNVEYRHTPEFTYPTPFHDVEDAYEWAFTHAAEVLEADPDNIIVGGVSAGAQLAASLAQTQLREPTSSSASLKGQVLIIPATVMKSSYAPQLARMESKEISSYTQNETAPILPLSTWTRFNDLLFPDGPPEENDRKANPGNALPAEVANLPPTVFGIAGADILRDEGLLYADLLASNGVPTNVNLFKGVPHGFRRFGEELAMCAEWDKVIEDGIRWILSNPKANAEVVVQVH